MGNSTVYQYSRLGVLGGMCAVLFHKCIHLSKFLKADVLLCTTNCFIFCK
uniref:Uncharacterized protein n=1 Tax=Anguilla anguilla TaxID=7936 RepID=A0A0E9U4B9_ANGAN